MRSYNFLISRPDRLGDTIASLPVAEALKQCFPGCGVTFMVRPINEPLFANNPFVDSVITYDQQTKDFPLFLEKLKEIRSRRFTHAFMLLPNEKINYLLFLAGIPYRAGVGNKLFQKVTFTRGISRNKYIPLRHETDYCLDMVRAIGGKVGFIPSKLYLSAAEALEAQKLRRALLGESKVLVGIHCSSGGSAANIPLREYIRLAEMLSRLPGVKTVITDLETPPEVKKQMPFASFPSEGKTLRQSILLFAALDALICNSTGPMHIAGALGIKGIHPFCPLPACSPKLWAPQTAATHPVLPKEGFCSQKCPGDPKQCTFSGEGGIDAQMLYAEFLKIFPHLK